MAYRKTEKVLATLEARRSTLVASAIDVIAKHGLEGFNTENIRIRAGLSVGLIYKYFPDLTELLAAATQQLLERDLNSIRQLTGSPSEKLASGISLLAKRFAADCRLMSVIGRQPAYREPMRSELAKLIKATEPEESPTVLAQLVYGGIMELSGTWRPSYEQTLVRASLRLVGLVKEAVH